MGNLHLITGRKGENHITAADHGSFNAAIFGEGSYVLNRGSKFAASVISNNQIDVADGDLLFQGRHIRLNENKKISLTIETGTPDTYRRDLIVARYTRDSSSGKEDCNLIVIKGKEVASSPADPSYNNGSIIKNSVLIADMPLYRVPLNGINVGTPVALFKNANPVPDGSVTNVKLASSSVGTSKLIDSSVTAAKMATGAIYRGYYGFVLSTADWVQNEYGSYEQTKTTTGYGFSPDKHIGFLGHSRGIQDYPGTGNTSWGWAASSLKADKKKMACLYSAKLIAEDTIKFVASKIPDGTLYVTILFFGR